MGFGILGSLAIKIGADVKEFDTKLQKVDRKLDGFGRSMKVVGAAIGAAFVADQAIQFGKEVFNVTKEFQKLNAVLENSLGSKGAADAAFRSIQNFAAKTPFQVKELTQSYVKLVNRGIQPTGRELRALGDLAASQGKSFDQLTEAVLDGMTGEMERLKEFGIRAKQAGDKVQFTFKGVTTEVQKTDDAIKDYLISLGDVNGVSGSMAAVSQTLEGKMSNLGDTFDRLFFTLGQANSGVLVDTISKLTKLVEMTNYALTDNKAAYFIETSSIEAAEEKLKKTRFTFAQVEAQYKDMKKVFEKEQIEGKLFNREVTSKELGKVREEMEYYRKVVNEQYKALVELRNAERKSVDVKKEEAGILASLRKQLKDLTSEREKSVSKEEILGYTQRIEKIQDEIKALTTLSKAKEVLNTSVQFDVESKGPTQIKAGIDLEKIANPVDSGSLAALTLMHEEFAKIDQKAIALGGSFNVVEAQISALESSIQSLIDQGFGAEGGPVAVLAQQLEELKSSAASTGESFIDMGGMINGVFDGIGDSLGNALSGDASGALDAFTGMVAGFMGTLGKQVTAIGVAKLGLDKLLTSPGGGPALIAAGITLTALSKAISNTMSRGVYGGGRSSQTADLGRSAPGAGINTAPVKVEVEGSLQGSVIKLSQKKHDQRTARVGG